jgi:hypothetical protein
MNLRLADLDNPGHDGTALLAELHTALGRYVIFPSQYAHDAVTLWIAASHGQPAWEHASRLGLTAPEKRCGKTRAQTVIEYTCHKPLAAVNATTAAAYRSIDEADPPTLLFDEVDALFGSKRKAEDNEDLRALLNAGHERGRPVIRCVGPRQEVAEFPAFAMACLAGIGDLPDTIADRAIVVHMRRRAPGETVSPFRRRRDVPPLHNLRDQLHEWVTAHLDELANANPDMPVEDRAADTWEPLVAIADLAGDDWPDRARKACAKLTGEAEVDDDLSMGVRLLSDLQGFFAEDALWTEMILDRLNKIEEAPWGNWYGRLFNAHDLAQMLRPYGIRSRDVKLGGTNRKGYRREDFWDAWTRYGRTGATGATGATSQVSGRDQVAGSGGETLPATSPPLLTSAVAEVAQVADPRPKTGQPMLCRVCDGPLQELYVRTGRTTHPGCRAKTGGER